MINNKEYIDFLKKIIACISYGDYYSVKEFSVLTLQHLESNTTIMENNVHKYVNKYIYTKGMNKKTSTDIVDKYMEYLLSTIKEKEEISKVASLEEFMQNIQRYKE